MKIEDTISDMGLPVNSIAMLNRGIEILRNRGTNCAHSLQGESLQAYRKILWLINQQVHGQTGSIDMMDEWAQLAK